MNLKDEYLSILTSLESELANFSKMEEVTKQLKELYKQNPNDENLIKIIKEHENEYKKTYEIISKLNLRATELKAKLEGKNN